MYIGCWAVEWNLDKLVTGYSKTVWAVRVQSLCSWVYGLHVLQ